MKVYNGQGQLACELTSTRANQFFDFAATCLLIGFFIESESDIQMFLSAYLRGDASIRFARGKK